MWKLCTFVVSSEFAKVNKHLFVQRPYDFRKQATIRLGKEEKSN